MHGKGPFVRNEWLYKKVCSSCDRGGEPLNPRGDRGDTSNWPWGQDSPPAKAILQQSRAGVWCQLCLSLLCFLGEPRGSARRSPHPGLQPLLQNCTCCISTGSLEDIPGSLGKAESFKVFRNEPAAGCQMLFLICGIRTVVLYLQFSYVSYGKSGEQLWSFPFKFFLCSVGDGRIDDQGGL